MKPTLVLPGGLRLVLFSGLILHKIVWEVWRLRRPASRPPGPDPTSQSAGKRALKAAKAGVLAGLLTQTLFVSAFPIRARSKPLRAAGLFLFLAGLATAIAGRIALGQSWSNIEDDAVREGHALVTSGVYQYIRHPIYAGDVLLLFGLELALNSWLAVAMLVPLVVFVRQALAEEARLARSLPGYEGYRRRTKRFVPFVL